MKKDGLLLKISKDIISILNELNFDRGSFPSYELEIDSEFFCLKFVACHSMTNAQVGLFVKSINDNTKLKLGLPCDLEDKSGVSLKLESECNDDE